METQQKTQLEQRAVAALFVVFVVVLFLGPLKSLGVFRRQPLSATPLQAPREAASSVSTSGMTPRDQVQRPVQGAAQQHPEAPVLAPVARYTAQSLRDPLQSLFPTTKAFVPQGDAHQEVAAHLAERIATAPTSSPHLTVQGLWWGSEQPKAIINGDVYGLNDVVEGARIMSIGREGVVVEWAGKAIQLTTQPR